MRKKLFTFLLALATSVGLSWATVITWDASKVSSMAMNVSSGSDSKTSDGITVTAVSTGEFVVFGDHGGAIEIGNGEGSGGGYLTFTSSVGNITQIDINHSGEGEWRNANGDWISPYYINFEGGMFRWSGTPAASVTLTGDAPRYIYDITSIEFTIEDGGGSASSGDEGKLSGAFSVSGTKVVYFSKGNLQATTSDQGATWTWGFAENQWDYVGDNAANTSFDYWGGTGNGSYDLFGWIGASSTLNDYRQYGIGSNYDFTDCGNTPGENLKVDWGSLMGSDWRTLTYDEWQYLIKSRNNAANLLAYATVNGKTGLILLPDSWASSSVALTITTANYTTNIISASDWSTLEEQGCVFLPAAGWRSDDSVSGVGEGGDYWSSSSPSGKQYDEGSAYCFFFDTDFTKQADGMHFNKRGRGFGLSVRLVSETAPSGGSTPEPSETTVTWDLSYMASMGTQGGYFKAKGVTLMSYGVENGIGGYGSYDGAFFCGPFVFTTSLGKFTKIEVTNSHLYEQPAFSGDGWTLDGTNAVWEGTPAALVSLVSNFGGITQIKFTIDPNTSTPANSCGDGLTWAVNDGVLTISYDGVGTGSMDNYEDYLSTPWRNETFSSVVLPEGLISIGQNAFADIQSFSQITLPSTLQYILMNAFTGCGLTSVTIPANVKGISASAFISSSSLATVTFEPTTPPRVGGNAFENCHNDLIIYYPCESRAQYYKDMQADIAYYHDKMYNCPAPPSNLHVTELEAPASWSGKSTTYLAVAEHMPGFEETDAELAKTWEAPTNCNSILIYHVTEQYGDDRMYYHYFSNGNYVASEDGWYDLGTVYSNANKGIKTFYTSSGGGSTTPEIKLNANFGGDWADTEAFTDNGDGTATLSNIALTAGYYYNFSVNVGDEWFSINHEFTRQNPSCVISNGEGIYYFQADVTGNYSFTWEYATNTLTIGYPSEAPSIPTVGMKGSWDDWADAVNFTDNGDGTASATKSFDHEGYYTFKTVLDGDDWRGNGYTYKRTYTGAEGITENGDNMTFWVDAKGEYTFTWTYATNAINITYPTLPTIQTKGSWDNWTDALNFTDNGDGTASVTKHFDAEGYHDFKINVGADDWRGNGETFKRDYTGAQWINENGSDMKLYVDEPGDYTFTWSYVENALSIALPAQSAREVVTNGDPQDPTYYYSTFYHSANKYALPEDVEAFVADLSGSNLVLTKIAVTGQTIPSNTAVILRRANSPEKIQLIPSNAEAVTFTAHNSLQGVDMATAAPANCYVLSGTAQYGVGFYRILGSELKAHKAYVIYNGSAAPKRMRFVFNQEQTATGVENVQPSDIRSQKVLENGILYIIKNGVRYNAQGQIVK